MPADLALLPRDVAPPKGPCTGGKHHDRHGCKRCPQPDLRGELDACPRPEGKGDAHHAHAHGFEPHEAPALDAFHDDDVEDEVDGEETPRVEDDRNEEGKRVPDRKEKGRHKNAQQAEDRQAHASQPFQKEGQTEPATKTHDPDTEEEHAHLLGIPQQFECPQRKDGDRDGQRQDHETLYQRQFEGMGNALDVEHSNETNRHECDPRPDGSSSLFRRERCQVKPQVLRNNIARGMQLPTRLRPYPSAVAFDDLPGSSRRQLRACVGRGNSVPCLQEGGSGRRAPHPRRRRPRAGGVCMSCSKPMTCSGRVQPGSRSIDE